MIQDTREIVESIVGNLELEGKKPSDEIIYLCQRMAEGALDIDEAISTVIKTYKNTNNDTEYEYERK